MTNLSSDRGPEPLPEVLASLRSRPLFVMHLDVRGLRAVGATPGGDRRVGLVPSGTFEGERLSGRVLEGGSDWQIVRADGSMVLDARLVLETNDGVRIAMTYRGMRHGPPDVMKRIANGEEVDPSSYYFRTVPIFETASPSYDWLNRIVAIGIGHRHGGGPIYNVFEIL